MIAHVLPDGGQPAGFFFSMPRAPRAARETVRACRRDIRGPELRRGQSGICQLG